MSQIYTYNPKKVTIAFGTHMVSGYAEDSFISIEPAGDGTTYSVGADGEVVRAIDPNHVFVMKLAVLQNSRTNKFLENKTNEDQANGTGLFSVSINDLLGNEEFTGSQAWVSKHAPWNRGKEQNNREWEIIIADGKLNIR